MAAKHNREKRNFEKASQARETVIRHLNECQSYGRLQDILQGIQKARAQNQSPLKMGDFTEHHTAEIKRQDEQIERLIQQKMAQFANPEAFVLMDTSAGLNTAAESTEGQILSSDVIAHALVETNAVADSAEEQVAVIAHASVETTEDSEQQEERAIAEPIDNISSGANVSEEQPEIHTSVSIHGDFHRIADENDGKETSAPARDPVTANKKNQIQPDARIYKPTRQIADDFNHARAQELCAVRDHLDALKTKGKTFCKRSDNFRDNNQLKDEATYKNAAKSVAVIYRNIDLLCSDYEYNRITLDAFKAGCEKYLKDDNQDVVVANTHRQYKEVIANLLIAVTGVGLLAIAALSIYKGRFTLFKVATTDTGNKVHELRDSIACVQ